MKQTRDIVQKATTVLKHDMNVIFVFKSWKTYKTKAFYCCRNQLRDEYFILQTILD
jgi:sulfur relay (sulfurtransferase) DsrF/TusC family protein